MGAPVPPERHRNLVGHIEPPAIDTVGGVAIHVRIHPAAGDGEDVAANHVAGEPARALREHGQLPEASPTLVLEGLERLHREPVGEARLGAVRPHIHERLVLVAHMVEHAVEHDLDAGGMERGDEIEERVVAFREGPGARRKQILFRNGGRVIALDAEVVVDVQVVARVVLVRAGRLEHGVQVHRGHAERLDVRDLLAHARDVAAVLAEEADPRRHGLSVGLHLGWSRLRPVARPRARVVGIVRRIAVAESIHHDLIPHRALRPVGRVERNRLAEHRHLEFMRVKPAHIVGGEFERIRLLGVALGHADFPPVEVADARHPRHRLR